MKIEQAQRMHHTMRVIGSGFQSVLFADVRTIEDATACVRTVRAEAPGQDGLNGVGMRTVREAGSPAFVKALNDVFVVLMIEKRQCVEDLDATLAVKDIDMVRFGPADYALSIGLAGQWSNPDVVKAERLTIETTQKKGIHPHVEIGDPAEAARYQAMAVKHFCVGWDGGILHDWWQANGKPLRERLSGEETTR